MTIHFAPTDDDTADLLSLVAEAGHPSVDTEWQLFTEAIVHSSLFDGIVSQNRIRPLIAGKIAPRRVGAFYSRACREGLIRATGDFELSDDTTGRNSGKPVRTYIRTPTHCAPSVPAVGGSAGSPAGGLVAYPPPGDEAAP